MTEPNADDVDAAFAAVLSEAAIGFVARDRDNLNDVLTAARAEGPDFEVVGLRRRQPEFSLGLGAYMRRVVTPDRCETARAQLANHDGTLGHLEQRFGAPGAILIAIWGLESDFGRVSGRFDVLRALATLAATDPKRSRYWRSELVAALTIVADRPELSAPVLKGSWAGALGHVQFMPSVYLSDAVSYAELAGEPLTGPPDIWTNEADALASAAHYLSRRGWLGARWWGFEVIAGSTFDWCCEDLLDVRQPWHAWRAAGLSPAHEAAPVADEDALRVLAPEGAEGPLFLVTVGFESLLAYNPSTAYAIAVGLIADSVQGRPALSRNWLEDDTLLDRDAIQALQAALVARGWDTGGVDGMLGPATRRAVRARQREVGHLPDGFPTSRTVGILKGM